MQFKYLVRDSGAGVLCASGVLTTWRSHSSFHLVLKCLYSFAFALAREIAFDGGEGCVSVLVTVHEG